jgi:uncharacterized membrane protein
VIPSSTLAAVAGTQQLDEGLGDDLRRQVVLGPKRTAVQDIEFSATLLVEIAARALSPGINDFYTAIACVDHLAAALAVALERGMPSNLVHDGEGRLRVELHAVTFRDLADATLDPLRQEARSNVPVSIRLLESLTMLAAYAPTHQERLVLADHGRLIAADALAATRNDKDWRDIEARSVALREALEAHAAEAG